MRRAFLFLLLLAGPTLTLPADVAADSAPAPESAGFEQLLDSVVRIDVWSTSFGGGRERTSRGVGSGVIMTEKGHILTNAHVVNLYAERIWVTLNNLERVPASFVGWDHWTDLAIIRLDMEDIEERGLSFSHADFGDSTELEPGDVVYAVGTPNGLSRTVTRGIISNTNRFFEGRTISGGYETGYFNTWLQTDAAINPGNSGGPLVRPDGRVVGINTRSYLGANNLSFAVPSAIAKRVMKDLRADGEVVRSDLGIVPAPLQDLEDFYDLEVNRGMLIESVDPGSPADKAGLRPGDIVLEIDGEPVDGRFPEQLPPIQNRIASRPVGSEIALKIKRGDEIIEETVTTEPLESRVGKMAAYEEWGLSVQKISRAVAREEKLKTDDGVRVIGVQQAFPADEAGVRRGDIITRINGEAIASLETLDNIYEKYVEDPSPALMEVRRGRSATLLVLKPQE